MRKFLDYHKDAIKIVAHNSVNAFTAATVVSMLPVAVSHVPGVRMLAPLVQMLMWPFGDAYMCAFVDAVRGQKVDFFKTTWNEGKKHYSSFILIELIMHFLTKLVKTALFLIPGLRWIGKCFSKLRPQFLVLPRYLIHDNPQLSVGDSLKLGWDIVKRHPWMFTFLILSAQCIITVLFQPLIWTLRLIALIPTCTPVLVPVIIVLKILKSLSYSVYISALLSLYYIDLKAESDECNEQISNSIDSIHEVPVVEVNQIS